MIYQLNSRAHLGSCTPQLNAEFGKIGLELIQWTYFDKGSDFWPNFQLKGNCFTKVKT